MMIGIVLFVVGFLITLTALPGVNQARGTSGVSPESSPEAGSHFLVLALGLGIGLLGVVLSTVGPTIHFLRTRK